MGFAVAWTGYDQLYRRGGGRPLAWVDLSGELRGAEFPHPLSRLFADQRDLREMLVRAMPGKAIRVPRIDFARRRALLVAAGPRSSTGYRLRVLGVSEERGRIVVRVREETPSLETPVRARVTYPFVLLSLRTHGKPVHVDWAGRG